VLYRLFPGQDVPPPARITAGLTSFAAGDALGVPWEGRPASEIDPDQVPTSRNVTDGRAAKATAMVRCAKPSQSVP